MELAQLVGDRSVALRVAEPDRRGDVERALAARLAAHPAARGRRRRDEVAQQQVDLDRVASMREVARPLERDELAARRLGERHALRVRADRVLVAVHDEHRAADARAEIGELDTGRQADSRVVVGERLGRRLEGPRDAVLDLLRRVRLREALPQEELEEVAVVAQPVVDVVLRPPSSVSSGSSKEYTARSGSGGASATAGPMNAAPATRSGCSAASKTPQSAAHETPTTTARSVAVASSTASASSANSRIVYASAPTGLSERPFPRPSNVTTRQWRARYGDLHLPVPRVDERTTSAAVGRQARCRRSAPRTPAIDPATEAHARSSSSWSLGAS